MTGFLFKNVITVIQRSFIIVTGLQYLSQSNVLNGLIMAFLLFQLTTDDEYDGQAYNIHPSSFSDSLFSFRNQDVKNSKHRPSVLLMWNPAQRGSELATVSQSSRLISCSSGSSGMILKQTAIKSSLHSKSGFLSLEMAAVHLAVQFCCVQLMAIKVYFFISLNDPVNCLMPCINFLLYKVPRNESALCN